MFRPAYLVGFGIFLITGWQALFAANPKWDPVSPAELADDKPVLEPEAPAEIISYRLEIDDRKDDMRDVLRRFRYKIYDPSRTSEITRVTRVWNGIANRDYEIFARLTLPDGTSRTFGKHDLRERNVAEMGRANGLLGLLGSKSSWAAEEKFLAITGVVKGAVLDIWEREPHIEKDNWFANSIQQQAAPIRKFEYVNRFKVDPERLHRVYVLNPNGGKLAEDKKEGKVEFRAENLPSIRRETFSPPDTYFSLTIIEAYESLSRGVDRHNTMSVPLPKSVPGSLGPWAYYSTRMDFYDADKGYATKAVQEKARELAAGAADQKEKARRIYYYVRSLYQRFRARADLENWYTRYIETVDELIKLDKIDSTIIRDEDFVYLQLALARAAGLEAHSVFHPWRSSFPFSVNLVSEWFILHQTIAMKTDNDWVLCDPCAEVPLPYGSLLWAHESQPALMAMPQQQVFLDVQPPPPENSRAEKSAALELDDEGNLQGECVLTLTGHSAHYVRERLHAAGREEWGRMVRSIFDLEDSSAEARLLGIEGLDSPEESVRLRAFVRWPAYAPVLGNRMMFSPSVFCEGSPPLLNASKRTTPVFFLFPRTTKDTITVRLPKGYAAGALFKPISAAASGLFTYALAVTYDREHGQLEVQREAVNRATGIPTANYEKTRDWFRRVSVADQISITLARNDPAASK